MTLMFDPTIKYCVLEIILTPLLIKNLMLGAITGDVLGSWYEISNIRRKDFDLIHPNSRYTDDSVLTLAIAHSLIKGVSYQDSMIQFGREEPDAGYGGWFYRWIFADDPQPYNSWGNGSAMRVSPIGHAFDSLNKILEESKLSAEVTHNHPEGIKGAQSVASAIFLAKNGNSKTEIGDFITDTFGYDLEFDLEGLQKTYKFDVSCQGSVPQAIFCFLESKDFEDAIRNAISIGGDSDTIACITGSIAEAHYGGVPHEIKMKVLEFLPEKYKIIIEEFQKKFRVK